MGLLLLLLSGQTFAQSKKAYVYAPSGLNMRAGSALSSDKIAKANYGDEVTILAPASGSEITVDNINGRMIKVQYSGKTGYMFDGYLAPYQQGKTGMETAAYVEQLRNGGHEVMYESHEYDYGGYLRHEDGFSLYTDNWVHAFLVAKHFYDIPAGITLPAKGKEKFENPDKKDHVWSDELMVTRDKSGNIKEISYFWRAEGGGWGVNITKSEEINGLRIINTQIAD